VKVNWKKIIIYTDFLQIKEIKVSKETFTIYTDMPNQ